MFVLTLQLKTCLLSHLPARSQKRKQTRGRQRSCNRDIVMKCHHASSHHCAWALILAALQRDVGVHTGATCLQLQPRPSGCVAQLLIMRSPCWSLTGSRSSPLSLPSRTAVWRWCEDPNSCWECVCTVANALGHFCMRLWFSSRS